MDWMVGYLLMAASVAVWATREMLLQSKHNTASDWLGATTAALFLGLGWPVVLVLILVAVVNQWLRG